jgi:acetyl esterase/lipase
MKKSMLFLIQSLFVLCLLPLPAAWAGTQAQPRVEELVYKKTPQGELKIYVHYPKDWIAQDTRPVIVFFFGGGWTFGTVEQFRPQAEYLAQRGMVAARADYRVKNRHGTTPDKCVEDAKSAVRWVRANAAKLGIDPQRIVASGGSAGGHIAACTATIPDDPVAPPPPRVTSSSQPGAAGLQAEGEDLSISSRPNLLVLFNPVLNTDPIGAQFGMGDMARKISPNHCLSKDVPPTLIFFGTEDRLNEGGKEFIAKAKDLGFQAQMYLAPGQPHGFFNRPPWLQRTMFQMDEFLAAHGYLAGKPTLDLPAGGPPLARYEPTQ